MNDIICYCVQYMYMVCIYILLSTLLLSMILMDSNVALLVIMSLLASMTDSFHGCTDVRTDTGIIVYIGLNQLSELVVSQNGLFWNGFDVFVQQHYVSFSFFFVKQRSQDVTWVPEVTCQLFVSMSWLPQQKGQ